MKIIINYSNTKRQINGDFEICGSKDDLTRVANQILTYTGINFSYGWIPVHFNLPSREPNTPPKDWDE